MRNLSEILGDGLRKKRLEAGFKNLKDVPEAGVEISINGLSMLERGERWPRKDTLEELAKLYGCQSIEFFTCTLESPTAPKIIIDKEVKDAIAEQVEKALVKLGHSKKDR